MSEQGAKLQRLNNDLVKVIESLRGQRDDLRQERDSIANQKRKVEAQLVLLAGEARELDKRLKESNAALGTVEDAIRDAEQSYSKILRGSELLLSVLNGVSSSTKPASPTPPHSPERPSSSSSCPAGNSLPNGNEDRAKILTTTSIGNVSSL